MVVDVVEVVVDVVVEVDTDVDVELEVLVEFDVLVELEVDVLVVLVEDEVLVEVVVVPQAFVQPSSSLALPSSHASPESICTMPSPQIVHGSVEALLRHSLPLAGQSTCEPAGEPHGFGLPSARIAGQHCPGPGTPGNGSVSQVSKGWFTMPSPHTAGKLRTALPPALPRAHSGSDGGGTGWGS